MSLLKVLHFPDPRLRNKALEVLDFNEEIKTISEDMLETMYEEKGIGLAAIQVNIKKRIIVIDVSEERDEPLILVNPVIIKEEGKEQMQEGCLSVPGYYETVERADNVDIRYQDVAGDEHELHADGLLAVCIQHEIDHLDGKLFIDYLSPLKQNRLRKKLSKIDKLAAT